MRTAAPAAPVGEGGFEPPTSATPRLCATAAPLPATASRLRSRPMGTVVVADTAAHVKTITLDKPDRLNAISFDLVAELHDALDQVAADDDCKVAILTGAG